jgi:hypothetical protein
MKNSTKSIYFILLFMWSFSIAKAQIDFEHFDVSYSPEVFGNAAEFKGFGIQHNDYNSTLQYTLAGNLTIEFWIKVSPVFENEYSYTPVVYQDDGAIHAYISKGCNEQEFGKPCETVKPIIGFSMTSTEPGIGYSRSAEIPGYNEWFHVALVSNQSVPLELPDDFYNQNWDDYPGGAEKAADDYMHNQTIEGEMSIYINGVKQKMIHEDGTIYFMRTPHADLVKKSTNPLVVGGNVIWIDDLRIWQVPKLMEGIRAGINREEFIFGPTYATTNGLFAYYTYNASSTLPGSGINRVVPNMSRGAGSPTNGSNGALAGSMVVYPNGVYPVFRSGHVFELTQPGNWGTPGVWKNFNETFPTGEDDLTVNIAGSSSEDIVGLNGGAAVHSVLFKKGKIATRGGEFWSLRSTLGASADSYIITDKGTKNEVGPFVQSFWVYKDKFVSLPIGNEADYLPVGITGKTWDGFRTWASVKEILPSGLGNSAKSLNVPWDIKTIYYGSAIKPGYQLKFQWNAHNEGAEFDRQHVYIANYHNGQWRQLGSGKPAEVISDNVFAAVTDVDEFSEFTALGTVTALPVRLTAFSVQQEAGVATLNWTTDVEENSSHFSIERSQDSKNWHVIGRVEAGGTGAGIRQYTFTDQSSTQLSNGMVYYRLKMIDMDQTFAYSSIRSVRLDALVSLYTIFPNPVMNGFFTLKNANVKPVAAISLMTLGGKKLADLKLAEDSRCKLPKLAPGIYLLEILGVDGSRVTEKLIIAQ